MRFNFLSVLLAAASLTCSLAVNASAGHQSEVTINWWGFGSQYADNPALGWLIITFIIFVGMVIYYVRKPLGLYLEARSRQISHAINEAKTAKEDARAQLQAFEEQLKSLDAQVISMKDDFRAQGETEKKRLAADAAKMSERIKAETLATIKAETAHVSNQLRAELADIIIKKSIERIAHGEVVAEESLRKDFVQDIAALSH